MTRFPLLRFKSQHKSQGMVEFALVMPILLMVIYGIFEVGRVIADYIFISSAAREAVRYGSATGLNVTGGIPRYDDCAGIINAAQNVDFLGVIDDGNILISYDHGSPSAPISGSCPPPASPKLETGDRIKVQVSGWFIPIIPGIIPWAPWDIFSQSSRTILVDIQIEGTPATPFVSTWTPIPTRTHTPIGAPSNTPIPTKTHHGGATLTATNTPTIGSPTATPMICAVSHSGSIPSGTDVTWTVHNPHLMPIEFNMLRLEWSIPTILSSVHFRGDSIYTGSTKSTGLLIPLPGGKLILPAGEDSIFRFTFASKPNHIHAEIFLSTLACNLVIVDSNN